MTINNDYYAMNLGELETEVLKKLWINPQEDSNGFPADSAFVKYSKYRVDKKINKAYSDMVTAAKALRTWFIVPLTANYSQYPVPPGVFDIETVYYFTSDKAYCELKVEEENYIESVLSPGWRNYPAIPEFAYVGDKMKMRIKLGIAPASIASATAITIGTNATTTTRSLGSVDAIAGVAGPDTNGTNFVDALAQNFIALGIIVGLSMVNIDTGVVAPITSITTTTNPNDTLVSSISWTAGQSMRIIGGEIGSSISIGDTDATYILSSRFGEFPNPVIQMAANNLLVRGFTQPVSLMDKYQYPELNPLFHSAIALGAASELAMEEPTDSPEYAQGISYGQNFNVATMKLSGFVANQYKGEFTMRSR